MTSPLPFLFLAIISPTVAQTPTVEQRLELYEQFFRAPSLVTGGEVRATWLDDGSTFLFQDGSKSKFVNPLNNTSRAATKADRNSMPTDDKGRPGVARSEKLGRYAVLEKNQLKLAGGDLGPGKVVTNDGSEDVIWTVPSQGWSSDGNWFYSLKRDASEVHKLPIVDYTQAIETVDFFPYLKAGTSFAKSALFIFNPKNNSNIKINTGTLSDIYLFPIGWREDDSELLFLRMNREASQLDLMAADPNTGQSRIILSDTQSTFVGGLDFIIGGWMDYFTPVAEKDQFLWISERDGWRHIYLYDYQGKLINQVTKGQFPVQRVLDVEPKGDHIFVMANAEERLYDTHLYRVKFDGSEFKRLTEGEGEHHVQISPSKRFFIDNHSGLNIPPVSELRDVDGKLMQILSVANTSEMDNLGWTPPEPFTCNADDGATQISGVIFKPSYFDPDTKYPVIDYIYSGPFITTVPNDYKLNSAMARYGQAMAQMGFIIFIIDPRGTTERSKAFQDASYGRIGQIEIPDHVAALKQIAETRPYMDLNHVGVYGHSWGGYFALRAMLTAPDVFHAGVAGAPGELTEAAAINEPYMRTPKNNRDGYAAGLNAPLASHLKGNLMIIQGTSDVNAPFSTSMRMVQALIEADKYFDLVVFPGGRHSFRGAQKRHEAKRIQSFFLEHLRGEVGIWD